MSLNEALGRKFTFELGGRSLVFSELELNKLASFTDWHRDQMLAFALRNAQPEERIELIRTISGMAIEPGPLLVNMTAPAMRYLLWLSAHENDPSLTEEEIGALVTVVRIEELNELLRLICGMTEAAEGELGGSPTPASQESESSS